MAKHLRSSSTGPSDPGKSHRPEGPVSIGEVARHAGIAASAIRYYEEEGLLPRPARRSGRRVYGPEVLEQLSLIELAKSAGFSIAEIKRLLGGFRRRTPPGERWRALATNKLEELDRRIVEATRMRDVLLTVTHCECPTLRDCARALEKSPLDP